MKISIKRATLIKRYKRFLADINLENGEQTTIHCANTGAMTGCAEPNNTIWYSSSDNPKRKYPHSWELTQTSSQQYICINTQRANQLAEEALNNQWLSQCCNFQQLKREVKYGDENSKVDFFFIDENSQQTYLEVKSVTLLENGQGYFPDTVTTRGQKHLRELIEQVEQGHRAVLLFAVLHSGINSVKAAQHLDAHYSELLAQAAKMGVEVIAYKASYTMMENVVEIRLNQEIPVIISGKGSDN